MTWILGVAAALLAAIILISFLFLRKEWNRTTFFDHTSINGFDVSGKSPEEVLPVFTEEYTKAQVHLTENGKDEAVWSLAEVGYTIDESAAVPSGAVLQSEDLTADTLYAGESGLYATSANYTYKPAKAAAYADKYWKHYNRSYKEYRGVDCANFVSQCLYAGGMPQTID